MNVVVATGQVESSHGVPLTYFWQAPAWHLPFVPQEAPPASVHRPAGSDAPVGTFVQVPSVPGSAHDWQAPPQDLSQQTPCAQNVDAHSVPDEQEAPTFFLPQELPLQTLGGRQLPFVDVHALKHDEPLQTYGLHGNESDATHWPVALQVEGGV